MDRHSQDDHIDHGAVPAERIAFVAAAWHRDIVERGRAAFAAELARRGQPPDTVEFFEVPGSFEIPLHAQILAKSGRYAAVVAAGFVVDGGIYRHEFVAATVLEALMRVQLDTGVPVISMVLTPQRFHEHDEHRRFFREHFVIKGTEAATACLETIAALKRVNLLRASPPRRLARRRPEARAAS